MKRQLRETLKEAFREWANDYLTVEKFAEHNRISVQMARSIINEGREYHDADVPLERYRRQ